MLFKRYNFTCRLETDAQLPYYKGSTFRGVFGRALKKIVCALKQQECSSCILNSQCVYVKVFETSILANTQNSRIASVPHPFVIEPPLTVKTYFPAGSCFEFSLLLMGPVNKSIVYFIYAFEQMGKIGIGRKINGRRGQFLLENVKCNGEIIYSSADGKLCMDNINNNNDSCLNFIDSQITQSSQNMRNRVFRLKLNLETPLRLKYDNKLQADLPFHILVRAMLRRMSSLMNAYGDGEPPLDYSGLVKKAQNVKIADKKLAWYDWKRYSFRQDQRMLMGGITGSIIYEGELDEYLPLAEFCEKVHLGKQTAFGLGKIKTEINPEVNTEINAGSDSLANSDDAKTEVIP